jgi:F-type H+-transporting ATPase subunit b
MKGVFMAAVPVLIPDPIVLCVQAGLFLTSVVVVKKTMLDPYRKLRAHRDGLTTGSSDQSKTLSQQAEGLRNRLDDIIKKSRDQARQEADRIRLNATALKEQIVQQAEAEASRILESATAELSASLAKLRQNKDQVSELSELLVAKVIRSTH